MDNLGNRGLSEGGGNRPIQLDESIGGSNVSHSPLNLGGGGPAGEPKAEAASGVATPLIRKPTEVAVSAERITGLKTFFTKLHAGAIEFLDEQITNWLRSNPGIVIKHTNTVVGEVQAKKTEPNVIITVWY
jgi:hypothetical protein